MPAVFQSILTTQVGTTEIQKPKYYNLSMYRMMLKNIYMYSEVLQFI